MSFKIFSYRESWSRRQHRQFNENKRKEALFFFFIYFFLQVIKNLLWLNGLLVQTATILKQPTLFWAVVQKSWLPFKQSCVYLMISCSNYNIWHNWTGAFVDIGDYHMLLVFLWIFHLNNFL